MKKMIFGIVSTIIMSSVAYADITGAGATFPYPVYSLWAQTYKNETGNIVNYQSIGSGAGIKQIKAKTVNFGATDMPLKEDELKKDNLIQFPTVIGGVVVSYNLKGLTKPITLSGEVLAKIYDKEITTWDDASISALNPDIVLPKLNIIVVYRSDGSGTTFVFTEYLSNVYVRWSTTIGSSTTVKFPVGVGAKGNEGVAANILQLNGTIGYIEYAYAKSNNISVANLINKDGNIVSPSIETFQASAQNTDWKSVYGFGVSLTNQPGMNTWPITSATFILVHKENVNGETTKFFDWAFKNGTQQAIKLEYVPLPDSVISLIKDSWK